MSDDDTTPDGGGNIAPNPNTDRELKKARDDAKRYREELDRTRSDLEAERKVSDGLRGKLKQTENDFTAKLAERDEREAATAEKHEEAVSALRAKQSEVRSAHETELAASKKDRDDVMVTYELRNAAIKAGVINENDLVTLIDRTSLKLDSDGKVKGVTELVEKAKAEKPYLFTQPEKPVVLDSSSSTRQTPVSDDKPKNAKDMTKEEWETNLQRARMGAL